MLLFSNDEMHVCTALLAGHCLQEHEALWVDRNAARDTRVFTDEQV
jgi:hypothetical protein